MPNEKPKKIKSARNPFLVAVVVISYVLLLFFATLSQKSMKTIEVNNATLRVDVATTSQQKKKGLCCRDIMPADYGMLFVYERPGDHRFWMKDTRIPLDMIWLGADKRVIHIESSVRPDSYPTTYASPTPAQYILETHAGWVGQNDVAIGDVADF